MPAVLQEMYNGLLAELEKIASSGMDALAQAERSVLVSKRVLLEVKTYTLEHPFYLRRRRGSLFQML